MLAWEEGVLILWICWKMHIISQHLIWPSLYMTVEGSENLRKQGFINANWFQLSAEQTHVNLAAIGTHQGNTVLSKSCLFFQKTRVAKRNLNQKYGLTQRCIYPALQLAHLLPCSQPWRVFFFKRKLRLCHFKTHKVQNNSTEALWTRSEDYRNGVWSCCCCLSLRENKKITWVFLLSPVGRLPIQGWKMPITPNFQFVFAPPVAASANWCSVCCVSW